jgi:membrane-bound lytic murein transglycosylase A
VSLCRAVVLSTALILSACASGPPKPGVVPHGPAVPKPPISSAIPHPERFDDLVGWTKEDFSGAFDAYRATCQAARDPAGQKICRRAQGMDLLDQNQARAFFEDNFQVEALPGDGVLTAYFAPEYQARAKPDGEFSAPVRAKPSDLKTDPRGSPISPYPDRAWIEARGTGDILAWMRPEELFFLQIQGSGVLTYPDGRRLKALYAAHNGRPFSGIANAMRDRGLLAAGNTSGEAIREWLATHRGPQAAQVMQLNPRYVFFRLAPDDGLPPAGAAGAPLPAGRAIALDLTRHTLGELYWIDGTAPLLNGAFPTYRRLVTGLDTGGAIKGHIRADLYLGQGPAAGVEAGRVRHTLRLHRLVPRP